MYLVKWPLEVLALGPKKVILKDLASNFSKYY